MTTNEQDSHIDASTFLFNVSAKESDEDSLQEVPKVQNGDLNVKQRKPSHPLEFVDDEDPEEKEFLNYDSQMYSKSAPTSQVTTSDNKLSATVHVKAGNVLKNYVQNDRGNNSFEKPKEKEKSLLSGLKTRINAQLDTLKDRVHELADDLKIGNSRNGSTENITTNYNQLEAAIDVAASSSVSATQAPISSVKLSTVGTNDEKADNKLSTRNDFKLSKKKEKNGHSLHESEEHQDGMRPRSSSVDLSQTSEAVEATEDTVTPNFTYSASFPSASGNYLTDIGDGTSSAYFGAADKRKASKVASLPARKTSSEQNETNNNRNKPSASASVSFDRRSVPSAVLMSSLRAESKTVVSPTAAAENPDQGTSFTYKTNGEVERDSTANRSADVLAYTSNQKPPSMAAVQCQRNSSDSQDQGQSKQHGHSNAVVSTLRSVASHKTAVSVLVAVIAVALYFVPSFVSGLLIGAFLGSGSYAAYHWLFVTGESKHQISTASLLVVGQGQCQQEVQQQSTIPTIKEAPYRDLVFKGWMNEVRVYEETAHHIRQVHSVYVTLDGSTLRIQRPAQGVPKRALWSEQLDHAIFKHQRYFDLVGANVHLVPVGLVRKRWWSKKYPICIEMAPNAKRKLLAGFGQSYSSNDIALSSASAQFPNRTHLSAELMKRERETNSATAIDKKNVVIYLFARASREKEEWFQRFRMASRGTPLPVSLTQFMAALENDVERKQALKESDEDKDSSSSNGQEQKDKSSGVTVTTSKYNSPSKDSLSVDSDIDPDMLSGGQGTAVPMQEIFVHESVEDKLVRYLKYMGRFLPRHDHGLKNSNNKISSKDTPDEERRNSIGSADSRSNSIGSEESSRRGSAVNTTEKLAPEIPHAFKLNWLNGLLGRLFYDFLHDPKWTKAVQNKIQHKISKLHVPYFIDELVVRDVHLGEEFPLIKDIVSMQMDERGLWVNADIEYNGGFCATLETKVNLMKFKKEGRGAQYYTVQKVRGERSAVTHSSEEDSGESSSEEEAPFDAENPDDNTDTNEDKSSSNQSSPAMSKKIMWWVEKVTSSRYFQQATEYKYVKRAMEEVSNTPIVLTAQIHSIVGTLAVNIPPPPTDRIWFGFRPMPQLVLSAKPKVGVRTVNITRITDFIEHKIQMELQRVFVLPNMDDIYLPIMSPMMDHEDP